MTRASAERPERPQILGEAGPRRLESLATTAVQLSSLDSEYSFL